MLFIKVNEVAYGEKYLTKSLQDALNKYSRIVWFVSGGSNIRLAINILNKLGDFKKANLRVLLTDERYGKFDNEDSNLFQLEQAGFAVDKVTLVPVLESNNQTFDQTVAQYEDKVAETLSWAEYSIGQFGIGEDGHTAGILPNSEAVRATDRFVAGYKANDYLRITMTFKAIKQISVAYVYAFGKNKRTTLSDLADKDISIELQPAQIFKQTPEAYIINDMIGETV